MTFQIRRILIIAWTVVAFGLPLPALGDDGSLFAQLSQPLGGHVVDQAGNLDPDTARAIRDWLASYQKQNGARVVVVTLRELGQRTIDDWGGVLLHRVVAPNGRGVVIVVAPVQHQADIVASIHLRTINEDADIVVADDIVPAFASGDVQGGVLKSVSDVLSLLDGQPIKPVVQHQERAAEQQAQTDYWRGLEDAWPLLAGFVAIRLIISWVRIGYRRMLARHGGSETDAIGPMPKTDWF